MTMPNVIAVLQLGQVRPAPWNPPGRMAAEKVQGLADSIRREGQRSAILVRPLGNNHYEIVFGHRRYAALMSLAAEDSNFDAVRAEIEEMDEDRARLLSSIENLQRENLSDLEEAEFFQLMGVKYGELAVKELALRLSVSEPYIRKRLEILKMPDKAVDLWRQGVWTISHMEQLLRLGGNDRVMEFMDETDHFRDRLKDMTVADLRHNIDRVAVPLSNAWFSRTECKTCVSNTDCQRGLFDFATEKAKCLNASCFSQKQQAWLDAHWADSKRNKFGTRRAVVGGYNYENTGIFGGYSGPQPMEKCSECPEFVTILGLYSSRGAYHEQACLGEASCFAVARKDRRKKKDPGAGDAKSRAVAGEEGPRVPWHGEYYRQEFYHQELPVLVAALPPDDSRHARLALASLVYACRDIQPWFVERFDVKVNENAYFRFSFNRLLQFTDYLTDGAVHKLLGEAVVKIAMQKGRGYETTFIDEDRQAVAQLLDVDFSRFQVTEEYLKKKTKPELVRFITKESGLWVDPDFLHYIKGRGHSLAEPEKLASLKKGELVDLILKCGIDLHGRLPQEIASIPELDAPEGKDDGV